MSTTIKKAFVPIISLLTANPTAQVSDILDQAIELTQAKSGGGGGKATAFHKNEEGVVIAILCYYHKLWMNPQEVDFGKKASSATGYNSMCKDGVSKWTKQQSVAKQAKNQLLDDLAKGEVSSDNLPTLLADIEAERNAIIPREDAYGYATLEDLIAAQ